MDDNPLIYVRQLTWLKPKKIIPHWRENRKVLTRATDQDSEVSFFWSNEQPRPRLSEQQLIDVNNVKNPKHRTINRLLDWIMKHGVVAATDYDAWNQSSHSEEMFKCCKKDDVGPAPLRLSSYRDEGSAFRRSTSSEVSNMSRRGLTDVNNVPAGGRSGLYDMSSIQLPPLPSRSASYREEGASSARFNIGNQRATDVGSTSASSRRSNVMDEHLAFPYQTSPPCRIDCHQAYIDQCTKCASVALKPFQQFSCLPMGLPFHSFAIYFSPCYGKKCINFFP